MNKYKTGNKVKVVRINNKQKAIHLLKFVGSDAEIISWIAFSNGVIKYKLRLDNDLTAYFREDEIELLETDE